MIALGYIRRSKESGARAVTVKDQRARIGTREWRGIAGSRHFRRARA